MTFTDDDLKRLKEGLNGKPESVIDFESGWLTALLHRLECAERLIWSLDPHEGVIDKDFVRESRRAWLRSKGGAE